MEKHERRCFRNPNRFCDECKNTGEVVVAIDNPYGGLTDIKEPCYFCSKRDLQMEKEIAEREAKENLTNLTRID